MDYSREMLCRMWLQSADAASWNGVHKLLEEYGNAEKVWDAFSPAMRTVLSEKGFMQLYASRTTGRDQALLKLDACRANVLLDSMHEFPERLRNIPDPPDILFVRGKIPPAGMPAVAIVGSRHDTRYGREMAFKIARGLAQNGVVVISGLARGIDTAAHEGALKGGGRTVAFLGNGIETIYPPENKDLAERILNQNGAIISEFAPSALPLPFHFPIRNRLISGLADAVLLIEARFKSGTSSTVSHALSQGKDVFALPGNVTSPGSELPLQLLRDGAVMCVDETDILDYMRWPQIAKRKKIFPEESSGNEEDPVLKAVEREEKTFEELLEETGIPSSKLSAKLTMLEMSGKIVRRGGRSYAKA